MSVPGPCICCGATNYALSMGGPTICPSCDCGNFGAPTVTRQGKEIASLRARIATLTAALAKCDAALGQIEETTKYYEQPHLRRVWKIAREARRAAKEAL